LADHHFKRTPADQTQPATAKWLFNENAPFYEEVDVSASVLPTPKSIKQPRIAGTLNIGTGVKLQINGFDSESVGAALTRLETLGISQNEDGVLVAISKVDDLEREGYRFATTKAGVQIEATTAAGAFYGLQTLASLVTPGHDSVPFVVIEDAPRFEFRGMHIDVSRNFKSKAFILQVLDQMAAYKLNKFHFHLADDEGWRLQIPDLPELTEVGAFRCFDPEENECVLPQLGSGPHKDTEVNGYYTVEDYKEILAYAAARHIQVIPSMDMPGHSRAAIKSMNARFNRLSAAGKRAEAMQYLLHDIEDSTVYSSIQFYNDNTINACMDSSYDFIGKVIDEINLMHESAGNPLTKYHIGADETAGAWVNSSACKELLANNVTGIEKAEDIAAYFVERVSRMLAERNIEAAGWSDGMGHTKQSRMPAKVQSNAWSPLMWSGHEPTHEQANRGWDVVISSPDALYFDFPYEADAAERGYYWAARRINTRKIFGFMPENLPAHAEFWKDRQELPYEAKDTTPLKQGVSFSGMQGQLWNETVRGDSQASYMIFPRLYALAERAWHQASWEVPYDHKGATYNKDTEYFTSEMREQRDRDWIRFANHLTKKTFVEADQTDVFYRLPTVGATIENGLLNVNSLYPGLVIEYREAGSAWQRFEKPIAVKTPVEVRSVSPDGSRKGRTLTLK
jgi:hexosaminidase